MYDMEPSIEDWIAGMSFMIVVTKVIKKEGVRRGLWMGEMLLQ